MKLALGMALACMMIVVGTARLGAETNDQKPPAASEPTTEGCRLSLIATQPTYRFDQPISLQLVLKNESGKAVKILDTELMAVYSFEVRMASGKIIPQTLEGKRRATMLLLSTIYITMEPGKSTTDIIPMFNRFYDMTQLGEYSVTVSRHVWPIGKDGKDVDVVSNTIKIKITDEDGKVPSTNLSLTTRPVAEATTKPAK